MRGLQTVGEIAADTLKKGPKAKDVVVLAISAFEDFPMFNAGRGAALNRAGVHEVSSTLSIVDGHSAAYGAVGCTKRTKNPVLLANTLLEHGPHTMLVGGAAEKMAEDGRRAWPSRLGQQLLHHPVPQSLLGAGAARRDAGSETGTVGTVVLDSHGHFAAGGSTEGSTWKMDGRIGDGLKHGDGPDDVLEAGVSQVPGGRNDVVL
ncbi:hypothetical protein VUR80DRAFT_7550 [Thermomyces stellatus]